MKNFYILSTALDYIEERLCCEITQNDIAAATSSSLSSVQKLFRYCFHMSLGEYIQKRRLTIAAKELIETDDTILNIAIKCGFNSPEVFTRAFHKIWHKTPSEYRKNSRFSGIQPRLQLNTDGGNPKMKKQFDITELYDCLTDRIGKYVLSFDMEGLAVINETYGHNAGDLAILECLKRMESAITDEMLTFRIGGDEFVIVTNTDNYEKTYQLAESIIMHNGETVTSNGVEIPVSLRVGGIKMTGKPLKYDELFTKLVNCSRFAERSIYIDIEK